MKKLIIFFSVAIVVAVTQTITLIIGSYSFEKNYLQYWNLADKSSTITAKGKYIQFFVGALELDYNRGYFSSHNALFLKTPNNEFKANLEALKTLMLRLDEISDMDPSSFQYNAAIQQITVQEQWGAANLIDVFRGCYFLHNYIIVWEWIGGVLIALNLSCISWFFACSVE